MIYILLIGCTGFLGKCILYKLLKDSDFTIYVVIRDKNNVNYRERIIDILDEIKCSEYINRIIPINFFIE